MIIGNNNNIPKDTLEEMEYDRDRQGRRLHVGSCLVASYGKEEGQRGRGLS